MGAPVRPRPPPAAVWLRVRPSIYIYIYIYLKGLRPHAADPFCKQVTGNDVLGRVTFYMHKWRYMHTFIYEHKLVTICIYWHKFKTNKAILIDWWGACPGSIHLESIIFTIHTHVADTYETVCTFKYARACEFCSIVSFVCQNESKYQHTNSHQWHFIFCHVVADWKAYRFLFIQVRGRCAKCYSEMAKYICKRTS